MPISYNGYLQLLVNSNNTFTYCRGEVVCTVTTAKALDGAMAKEVEAALNSFLKKGQKAHIAYAVGLITLLKQYNSMDPVIPFILELDRISDPLIFGNQPDIRFSIWLVRFICGWFVLSDLSTVEVNAKITI